MRPPGITVSIATALALAGCANPERSRDLANPAIPALVIARQVCANCHGIDGNATSPNFPNLAGQPQPYLVSQLKGFRSHDRRDPAGFEYMWGLSRSLTDAQIEGLADYYAHQVPVSPPGDADDATLQAGQAIFDHGVPARQVPACASCHGAQGQGHDSFPRLAGQHADYVIKQLAVFQRTEERPDGAVMTVVAHGLREQDFASVAAYVQALPMR